KKALRFMPECYLQVVNDERRLYKREFEAIFQYIGRRSGSVIPGTLPQRTNRSTALADYVVWFDQLGMGDVERVGGKNASLGEMISHLSGAGVSVPGGFATTARAYREFLAHDGL